MTTRLEHRRGSTIRRAQRSEQVRHCCTSATPTTTACAPWGLLPPTPWRRGWGRREVRLDSQDEVSTSLTHSHSLSVLVVRRIRRQPNESSNVQQAVRPGLRRSELGNVQSWTFSCFDSEYSYHSTEHTGGSVTTVTTSSAWSRCQDPPCRRRWVSRMRTRCSTASERLRGSTLCNPSRSTRRTWCCSSESRRRTKCVVS